MHTCLFEQRTGKLHRNSQPLSLHSWFAPHPTTSQLSGVVVEVAVVEDEVEVSDVVLVLEDVVSDVVVEEVLLDTVVV